MKGSLYEEQLRVPLIVHRSGVVPAGIRARSTVPCVDVVPTVPALLGLH